MSMTTVDIWACDRCGLEDHRAHGSKPRGWMRVSSEPVDAHPLGWSRLLCRECSSSVDSFASTPDAQAVAS